MLRLAVCAAVLGVAILAAGVRADEASDRFEAAKKRLEERQAAAKAAATRPTATSAPAGAVPATQPGRPLESLWAALPRDCWPDAGQGWDQFSVPKARKWARTHLVGSEVSATFEVDDVGVNRIPDPNDRDETIGWEVSVGVKRVPRQVGGADAQLWVSGDSREDAGDPRPVQDRGELIFVTTEAAAKRFRALGRGSRVAVTGAVDAVDVEGQGATTAFAVSLRGFTVVPTGPAGPAPKADEEKPPPKPPPPRGGKGAKPATRPQGAGSSLFRER